jgi:hypothetical protein
MSAPAVPATIESANSTRARRTKPPDGSVKSGSVKSQVAEYQFGRSEAIRTRVA